MNRWRYNCILVVVDKLTKVAHFIRQSLKDGSLALANKCSGYMVYLRVLFLIGT